jgi:hypothetical protein
VEVWPKQKFISVETLQSYIIDPFGQLTRTAREFIARDPMQCTAGASALYVDFEKRMGFACGAFTAYGFKNGAADTRLLATVSPRHCEESRR